MSTDRYAKENDERVPLRTLYSGAEAFAAYTLRESGDGVPVEEDTPYRGFSVCHYTGDTPGHVAECRRQLCEVLGIEGSKLIIPRQTHSTNLIYLGKGSFGNVESEKLDDVDGIITDRTDIVTGVNTADCVPLVLIDSERKLGAAVHAGWRGAIGGIAIKAVREMARLGAKTERMKAFIGPCICVEDFEVGDEVAELFPKKFVCREYGPRPHVDLPGYIAWQLAGEGVKQVAMPPESTKSHSRRYFSARVSGVKSGRIFTFLKLK